MEIKKGFGVVGTWVAPVGIFGGALPSYNLDSEEEAIKVAPSNTRLMDFSDKTEQWLCEITIKPIRKLEIKTEKYFS